MLERTVSNYFSMIGEGHGCICWKVLLAEGLIGRRSIACGCRRRRRRLLRMSLNLGGHWRIR